MNKQLSPYMVLLLAQQSTQGKTLLKQMENTWKKIMVLVEKEWKKQT
jgi:hypothetical protein